MYTIRIAIRYSNTANATTATSSINTALSAAGRGETATRNSADVSLTISNIVTENEATNLINTLNPAWSGVARSYGKVSLVKTS